MFVQVLIQYFASTELALHFIRQSASFTIIALDSLQNRRPGGDDIIGKMKLHEPV